MVASPLATYYLTASTIFIGNATYAGAAAAVAANLVLIAYIAVAIKEDSADRAEASGVADGQMGEGKRKKAQ
jgi:vacuolar ATPase assembly integral membrane protein VMA21